MAPTLPSLVSQRCTYTRLSKLLERPCSRSPAVGRGLGPYLTRYFSSSRARAEQLNRGWSSLFRSAKAACPLLRCSSRRAGGIQHASCCSSLYSFSCDAAASLGSLTPPRTSSFSCLPCPLLYSRRASTSTATDTRLPGLSSPVPSTAYQSASRLSSPGFSLGHQQTRLSGLGDSSRSSTGQNFLQALVKCTFHTYGNHPARGFEGSPFVPPRHATTILCVRKGDQVCVAGDGMVSQGSMIVKPNARKIRRLHEDVICGFAGATADCFTLVEKLEAKLEEYPGQLLRACVELAKQWRTDRYLRHLEAVLIVADKKMSLEVSGVGDVLESHDGILGVGSGGPYAVAAARALYSIDGLTAFEVCKRSMSIAASMCCHTNDRIIFEVLKNEAHPPPDATVLSEDRNVVSLENDKDKETPDESRNNSEENVQPPSASS